MPAALQVQVAGGDVLSLASRNLLVAVKEAVKKVQRAACARNRHSAMVGRQVTVIVQRAGAVVAVVVDKLVSVLDRCHIIEQALVHKHGHIRNATTTQVIVVDNFREVGSLKKLVKVVKHTDDVLVQKVGNVGHEALGLDLFKLGLVPGLEVLVDNLGNLGVCVGKGHDSSGGNASIRRSVAGAEGRQDVRCRPAGRGTDNVEFRSIVLPDFQGSKAGDGTAGITPHGKLSIRLDAGLLARVDCGADAVKDRVSGILAGEPSR